MKFKRACRVSNKSMNDSIRFPVEAGHIMTFARAIGDPNPVYFDESYAARSEPGHVIAPPTFTSASAQFDPEYPLRPRIGKAWIGSASEPSGSVTDSGGGYLHAEQHFIYHGLVRAGDTLFRTTRPGDCWEREGRRGGNLQFEESITEFRDDAGELVITSRSIRVRTSQTIGRS